MLDVQALVERVGPALLRAVVVPESSKCVGDVVIAEPDQHPTVVDGDLVLGVAVVDREQAVELVRVCGEQGAAAVLLKPPIDERLVTTAEKTGVALVEVRPESAWAQLVWLVRAALARTGIDEPDTRTGVGDLFRLADAVADVVDAPVTIEDAHSQVLAYSARQDLTDPARVSTIMGRRQPADVLAKFRARGTFRKISKGSSAIFVPAQQDGTLPGWWCRSGWAASCSVPCGRWCPARSPRSARRRSPTPLPWSRCSCCAGGRSPTPSGAAAPSRCGCCWKAARGGGPRPTNWRCRTNRTG
ncbi:hypothetical protein [Saccharopolyspora hordei]|uniref:hypothetical protein n=1 Tax=Saccharopolyspora hordei TaxID=1838 RepID=UPI0031EF9E09